MWDRQVPIPPATPVLQLIKNAVLSNTQHITMKGDTEAMAVGSEWLHMALQSDLLSSDDIQGCFHVFPLPQAWRRWMVLSKPTDLNGVAGSNWWSPKVVFSRAVDWPLRYSSPGNGWRLPLSRWRGCRSLASSGICTEVLPPTRANFRCCVQRPSSVEVSRFLSVQSHRSAGVDCSVAELVTSELARELVGTGSVTQRC